MADTGSDPANTKVAVGKGDMFDRVTRFIKDVGFPMAIAIAMFAYFWWVGRATNDYMARGTSIMDRAINILERLEKKLP